jgi:serine protease Do
MVRTTVIFALAAIVSTLPPVASSEMTPTAPAVERGWLGAYLDGSTPPSGEGGSAPAEGIGVGGIVEDSPAEEAGLRASDRIVAVDGNGVATTVEAIAAVRRLSPGSWVSLSVLRRGDPLDLKVRLGSAPAETARLQLAKGWIGVEGIDLPPALREFFGAPDDRGVLVSAVEAGSPAESAGLYIGDVVYDVGGAPVRSAGELEDRVSSGGIGNTIEIAVARSGKRFTVESLVEKEPRRGDGSKER